MDTIYSDVVNYVGLKMKVYERFFYEQLCMLLCQSHILDVNSTQIETKIKYVRILRCYQFTYDLNTISNDQTLHITNSDDAAM